MRADAEVSFPVVYKGHAVGEYFADIVVEDAVVVELKCVERLGGEQLAQCVNYLQASGKELCLLLNFQRSDAVKGVGWNVLSRFWASGATGTVSVFAETGRRVGVLYTTELPRLLNNPYVQSIRYR